MSIAGLDPGHFPNEPLMAEARWRLMERDGVKTEKMLTEIQTRRKQGRLSHDGPLTGEIPASGDVDF